MKFKRYVLLAGLVSVVGLTACREDPTAAASGVPEAIVLNRSVTNHVVGDKFSIIAYAIDGNAQRTAGKLEATSSGPAVAVDSVTYLPELLESRVFLSALQKSTNGTAVTVSGHSLSKDVTVIIN